MRRSPLSTRPRPNRVTPFGTIETSPHKGRYLGNRGDLHRSDGTLGRSWRVSRWIACTQVTHSKTLDDLPDGAFVTLADAPDVPLLLWEGSLHPWSQGGYAVPRAVRPDTPARVLTPMPTVATLRAGYRPLVGVLPAG